MIAVQETMAETILEQTLGSIEVVDPRWINRAAERQLQLTKPPGSLGRLEEVANRCAAIQETLSPIVDRARVMLFAGDHGVCEEGVSPYPQSVTAQMVLNFAKGGAAINALARECRLDLVVVDVGIANPVSLGNELVHRPIAPGTRNFCKEAAMTLDQARLAVEVGIETVTQACEQGCYLLGVGEMGIGNTTVASALTAALTGLTPEKVVGRGTGADDTCLSRKVSAVERALHRHYDGPLPPLELLARLGGFEIAAICGACLAGARFRRPMVVDGFIATAAAAVAVQFDSRIRDYLFASHRSTEPGHGVLLERLQYRPLLDLAMRLGEGTGAALAMTVVRCAIAAFTQMATFESARVSGPTIPQTDLPGRT
jgi:nicotinate-nucleotide--dimethylbenzimidazole phosphoribosyltransferase